MPRAELVCVAEFYGLVGFSTEAEEEEEEEEEEWEEWEEVGSYGVGSWE